MYSENDIGPVAYVSSEFATCKGRVTPTFIVSSINFSTLVGEATGFVAPMADFVSVPDIEVAVTCWFPGEVVAYERCTHMRGESLVRRVLDANFAT